MASGSTISPRAASPPTLPGWPCDGAARSGRAGGDHQDPPAALLLHCRTAHPVGAPPHFTSATTLALGSPIQSRPGTIAHPAIFLPDGGNQPADPPSGELNVPANSRQLGPRGALLAYRLSHSTHHGHRGPPSSGLCCYLTPPSSPSIGIGLDRSPSFTHHPWCQHQRPSLRWIRA